MICNPTQIIRYPSPPSRLIPNCQIYSPPLLGFQIIPLFYTNLIQSLASSTRYSISEMDSRESSSEEDASLSLAKEASLLFHSAKFVDCLQLLHQLLLTKPADPKVFILFTHMFFFRCCQFFIWVWICCFCDLDVVLVVSSCRRCVVELFVSINVFYICFVFTISSCYEMCWGIYGAKSEECFCKR